MSLCVKGKFKNSRPLGTEKYHLQALFREKIDQNDWTKDVIVPFSAGKTH